jgi:hypothetical protein
VKKKRVKSPFGPYRTQSQRAGKNKRKIKKNYGPPETEKQRVKRKKKQKTKKQKNKKSSRGEFFMRNLIKH